MSHGRIVGIIADTRDRGIDRDPAPTVYFCEYPAQPFRVFLVRTHGEPMAVAQAVRLKIKELEPLRSVYDMAPLEEWIGDAFAQNRLRTVLLVSFALTALSFANPMDREKAFQSIDYVSQFARSGVLAMVDLTTKGLLDADGLIDDRLPAAWTE